MGVVTSSFEQSVSVEKNLINDKNYSVAGQKKELRKREDLVFRSSQLVPVLNFLGRDMHESNSKEHSAGKGVSDTHSTRVLAATSRPRGEHAANEGFKEANNDETNLRPEEKRLIHVVIVRLGNYWSVLEFHGKINFNNNSSSVYLS